MKIFKALPTDPKIIHESFKKWSLAKKLVFAAILGSFAAILQSAGGLLPGIGFAISPFSTMMVLFATIISLQYGFLTYLLAIILLILIEPSELFIFPFTTGLLGLSIGWGLGKINKRIIIILVSGIILCVGICIPLYLLGFPVFGPVIASAPSIKMLLIILGFSLLYSWLWLEVGLYFLRRIKKVFP